MLNQKDFYKTTKNSLALSQELQKPLKWLSPTKISKTI
jgi:hypothetical protein